MLGSLPALPTAKARSLRRRSFPRSYPCPARDIAAAPFTLGAHGRPLDPCLSNASRDLLALAQLAFAFGRAAAETFRDELALAVRARDQEAIATDLHGMAIARFLLLKGRQASVEAIAASWGACQR
jgi:hypothetical protein